MAPSTPSKQMRLASFTPKAVLSPHVSNLVHSVTPRKAPRVSKARTLTESPPPRSVKKPVPREKASRDAKDARDRDPRDSRDKAASPRAKVLKQYDRYIPNRHSTDMPSSHFHLAVTPNINDNSDNPDQTIIPKQAPPPLDASQLAYQVIGMSERVLDAPGIVDDYYLNLLDWSSDNNLAVALEGTVFVWNGDSGNVVEFCKASDDADATGPQATVTSVQWTADGGFLAVGVGNGDTQIWDMETQAKVRTMKGHTSRVGVLAWDRHIVSSGCRDGSIWHHDVRVANHKVGELLGHSQEVCGLKWRADGGLLASGGNDNLVNIWDARTSVPKSTKSAHNAAVKAIAWCPWQLNLLATGGGTNDRQIHFWNTTTPSSTPLNSIDTGSQVTSLLWSKTYKELVSSHGYPYNHLSIWGYPSCKKIVDLEGHDARVLHAAMSPDGSTVVTGASDENLKFWKAFERPTTATGRKEGSGVGGMGAGKMVGDGGAVEDELVNATKKMTIR
ncbi:ubiquitin-protein transferase activating protein [Podochytrium sp. JEL0797]|nr:ubiquitin-protein transferase activating protein [Podochytrium sp. JEL0797]